MIKDLEEIRAGLVGETILYVSRDLGLHYNTLRCIINGKENNPTYNTLVKLSKYLESKGK